MALLVICHKDFLFLLREVEDADGTKLQAGAVAEEADVTRLVEHARMVLMVNGIGIVLRAVGSHVVSLAGLLDVAIDDDFAIDGNGDVVALHAYFLFAPLA